MRRSIFSFYIVLSVFSAFSGKLSAQEHVADSLVLSGDAFHAVYDFESAIAAYEDALEILEDTLNVSYDSLKVLSLRDKLLLSENGRSMSSFAYSPVVVARHKFSLDDFFLYYPLPDRSWRALPNQLDSSAVRGISRALYAPDDAESIYFSAEDQDGIRNIYKTELQDTIWTYPSLLNEHLTSPASEIYPLISDDGKQLYFSSEGLYGVGGYDIYVSEWSEDDQDWSVPVNMGFPYSSPSDDFLFMNTEDRSHTIFASNRDCSADSVWVYILEFDNMPVRKAVNDPEMLVEIARLDPVDASETFGETEVSADMPENIDTRRYMNKMEEVRALRDSLAFYSTSLDNERNLFALSNDDDERTRLTGEILRREARIPQFQDSLDRAVAQLQKIEMEFLFSGVVIDPDMMMAEADREVVGEATSYAFTRMSMGGSMHLKMMEPEKKFDYSFMVLEEGQFAESNVIPDGIIYQIQMFSSTRKAGVSSLKGLSPVFERRNASGRYIYRVGLFNTYNDVLSKLNAVKKAGFRSAFITAYIDGKEVSVSKARSEENKRQEEQVFYRIVLVPSDGNLDPTVSEGIRQQTEGKDIAKSETDDGRTAFVIGPFSDKAKADALVDFIKAMGLDEVSCEPIVNDSSNL
ncbi:MAG: PD40 domain-containing protein [Bacteroidales bacterium]|nr:PD40 domain-containing protein [Bacteroidales bacterium]